MTTTVTIRAVVELDSSDVEAAIEAYARSKAKISSNMEADIDIHCYDKLPSATATFTHTDEDVQDLPQTCGQPKKASL